MEKKIGRIIISVVALIVLTYSYFFFRRGTDDSYIMLIPMGILLLTLFVGWFQRFDVKITMKESLITFLITSFIYVLMMSVGYIFLTNKLTYEYEHTVSVLGLKVTDNMFASFYNFLCLSLYVLSINIAYTIVIPYLRKNKKKK